jgi:hypothetical protein
LTKEKGKYTHNTNLLLEKLKGEAGKNYTNEAEEWKNYTTDNILTEYMNAVNLLSFS